MKAWAAHQTEIYLRGTELGEIPALPTSMLGLEEHAIRVLSDEARGYIVASAGDGRTARGNREAFNRWVIVPSALRGVADRSLEVTVVGHDLPAPLALAPVGVQTLAHPDGELASVRAAAALGVPYIHSQAASHSFEEVAAAGGDAPRWFQFYWLTDRDVCVSFLERAKASGFSALILTIDTLMLGWRPADLDRAYLPFLRGIGIANYTSDPVFMASVGPGNPDTPAIARRWLDIFPNPGLRWSDLAFLREHWHGPILLKGVLSADDARRAVDRGLDGVVVSNHGGRQIDGALAALDALPEIAEAVGSEVAVLMDSGVRSGADVFTAIALGADAVLLGRSSLYGLALAGQSGVEHVLKCTLAEFDLTLALAGHTTPLTVGRESVRRIS